ncbi:hydrolase [Myceligenerans pegani]|uniref:Hydrolase n=1 Tax=Myceligenerans pegani TaxID=2776917 RepID=A0ABR9N3U7_9MICO|nr:hydrolase [Myceligenerans sp. TRM 65318]MBE1877946.1 hydrolase [Myceligenerans sp. TRM 65318]MBE3020217.1 hydrolase [Myceligenerans sp. TRM 65318]
MTFWICSTCGVEHAERPAVCAICDDERQWVPADGQHWTTLDELAAAGERIEVFEFEPDLYGLHTVPGVGIGPTPKIVRTPGGNLMFDVPGYIDDDAVARVEELGGLAFIVASHPHMYGVQVEWSRRFGGVPVLVSEADAEWVARPDPAIETWKEDREILPGVTLTQPGGHFPGNAVAYWAAGAEGRGVLLTGDTIFANPDRKTVSFMRSYPNRLPLSGNVVLRIADNVSRFDFDRLYNNFDAVIDADARAVVQRSAERHAAWTRGDYDHLT